MNKVTWKDELIRGLKHFGGEAHRQELFEYIKNTTTKEITKEVIATLQKELERLSESSKNFSGTNVFYSVEGVVCKISNRTNHNTLVGRTDCMSRIGNYGNSAERLLNFLTKLCVRLRLKQTLLLINYFKYSVVITRNTC